MSTPAFQHIPVKTVSTNVASDQRFFPAIGEDGTPVWQSGDKDVIAWEIESMGWSHGAPSNRRDTAGIRGSLFLTGARVFAVSDDFVHGNRYRSYGTGTGVILGAVASKVSQVRATRAAQGTYLVGQMRLPWIKSVAFANAGVSKRFRGELRLVGQHVTAFGDPENVMLLLRLRHPTEVFGFVTALNEKIKLDRLSWSGSSDQVRQALNQVPGPESVQSAPTDLSVINYAGAFRILPDTVSNGSQSALSFASK